MLQVRECLRHSLRWWRDERSLAQRAAAGPNPVLRRPVDAGRRVRASHAGHQFGVKLASQPKRQRQRLEPLHAVLERPDVIGHFTKVGRAPIHRRARLRGQQFSQGRPRPLDPARQHGLASDEGSDQEVRVRQTPPFSCQAPDETISVRQRTYQPGRPSERRRQWVGYEGHVASGAAHLAARRSNRGQGGSAHLRGR